MKSPRHRVDPDGQRLPIKLDTTSNGEFLPVPLSPANRHANRLAQEAAERNARRLGSAAATSWSRPAAPRARCSPSTRRMPRPGARGGFFDLPAEAAVEPELAAATLETGEFIFDVQGHYVDPTGPGSRSRRNPRSRGRRRPAARSRTARRPRSHLACLTSEEFVKEVFLDSDTDMVVLSFVPARRDASPLEIEAADDARRIVDRMEGNHRLLLHGRVNPN